ncbi:MAG: ANTAR domain-containing protein [Sneathiellaceae bacterium]
MHDEERPVAAPDADKRTRRPKQAPAALSITVMVPRDEDGDLLIRQLQKTRAELRHIWPPGDDIPIEGDALFCQLSDDLPRRLPWLPGNPAMALVVVLPARGTLNKEALRNCAPHGVLQLPVSGEIVPAVLDSAREQFLYVGRMQRRIEKLDENLRNIRNVERAKAILISSRRISEEEAYGFLRRKAMERRVSIGALASMIVDSEDLLA